LNLLHFDPPSRLVIPRRNVRFNVVNATFRILKDFRCQMSKPSVSSEMIRAARALLRWDQTRLAEASSVSLATVKRLEAKPGIVHANGPTIFALVHALEAAGIEFTNGDRPGVRLAGSN
jgi:hypothetical protein